MIFKPLDEDFFQQDTQVLAKALLGKTLVKMADDGVAAGRIVETEAYMGSMDRAAHS